MTLNGHFTLSSVFFQVQNLPIYLYGQDRDIQGEGMNNIFDEGYIRAVSLYKAIKYSKTWNI